VTYGSTVTLVATVNPSEASGKVTFYEGANILGIGKLAGGTASFTTIFLPPGTRKLRAYYSGDIANAPASSGVIGQVVVSTPANYMTASSFSLGAPLNQTSVVTGDFDGDNKADVAVLSEDSNQVFVLLGKGDGTFQPAVPYSVSAGPLAVGDFNGDGKTDLAVAGDNQVSILLGNGDGTFQSAISAAGVGSPVSIVVADFNGDGKADIADSNYSGAITILLGNGDGTFQVSTIFSNALGGYLAMGDFNGDGKTDLVSGGDFIEFLPGNGDGTFQSTYPPQTSYAYHPVVADFNNDGILDLAANSAYYTGLWLGSGSGKLPLSKTLRRTPKHQEL
jgi:hypothetical protein